eukprot:gene7549-13334_t
MEKLPLVANRLGIYENPRHFPGYTGHCPGERYSFGETYGNSTSYSYSSYRHGELSNSKERLGRGGDVHIPFPTYYQHEPSLVIGTTTRTHRRWEAPERYRLSNESSNQKHIKDFKMAAEDHREQYKDHSGSIVKGQQFQLPKVSHQTSPKW